MFQVGGAVMKVLIRALVIFISKSLLPLSIVDDPNFAAFIKCIDQRIGIYIFYMLQVSRIRHAYRIRRRTNVCISFSLPKHDHL
jgi:hypothetical protein